MRAFVTVGSTFFNELIEAVLSRPALQVLSKRGFTRLVVQCGKYPDQCSSLRGVQGPWKWTKEGLLVEMWRYKPTLKDEYEAADLVISHAGSGTILEVLRMGKPMIVVPNPSLLNDHQVDLATEFERLGHLKASTTKTLAEDIESFKMDTIVPFPPQDPSIFRSILDEEMGFL